LFLNPIAKDKMQPRRRPSTDSTTAQEGATATGSSSSSRIESPSTSTTATAVPVTIVQSLPSPNNNVYGSPSIRSLASSSQHASPLVRDVYIIQQPPQHQHPHTPTNRSRSNSNVSASGVSSASPYLATTVTRRVSFDLPATSTDRNTFNDSHDNYDDSNSFISHHIIHENPFVASSASSPSSGIRVLPASSPIVQAEQVVIHVTDVQPLSPLSPSLTGPSSAAHPPVIGTPLPPHHQQQPPPPAVGNHNDQGPRRGAFQVRLAQLIDQCIRTECCQILMILIICSSILFFTGLFITSILALTDMSFYKQKELCPRSDCWVFVLMQVILAAISLLNHISINNDLFLTTVWLMIRMFWIFGFAIWGLYELWGVTCPREFERSLIYGVMAAHTYFDFALLCISFFTMLIVLLFPDRYVPQ
jgi:hypothetical protein